MGQLYPLCVIRYRAGVFDYLRNVLRRDEEKFRIFVNELFDQPGTGDAVDLRLFAGNPFHACSPSDIIYVSRVLEASWIRISLGEPPCRPQNPSTPTVKSN